MSAILNMLATNTGMGEGAYIAFRILSITCLVLLFVAALLAILVILFQQSNSVGIQGITASSETFFGKNKGQSVEYKLKKWTWISLIVLGVLSIALYVLQLLV